MFGKYVAYKLKKPFDIGMSADLEELDKYIMVGIDGKTQGYVINHIAKAVENKSTNIKFTDS